MCSKSPVRVPLRYPRDPIPNIIPHLGALSLRFARPLEYIRARSEILRLGQWASPLWTSIVATLELPPEELESCVYSTGAALIGSTAPLPAAALCTRRTGLYRCAVRWSRYLSQEDRLRASPKRDLESLRIYAVVRPA